MKQTKSKPQLRPATRDDYRAFYGNLPQSTMRAYVATIDDRVVGIGGVLFEHGTKIVFSDMKDEFRPYKVSIMKFARKVEDVMGSSPGVAVMSSSEPGAARLLDWLGFDHVGQNDVGEIYRWAPRKTQSSEVKQ